MHTDEAKLQATIAAILAHAPQLPGIIAPHPSPFFLADTRWVSLAELRTMRANLLGMQRALKGNGYVNPVTVHHLAEHIVGLHKQLAAGEVKLTRPARGVTTARGLMALLEATYDALEPLAA
jgi:hypothetical protein